MSNFDWTCPFCNRNATLTSSSVHTNTTFLIISNFEGSRGLVSEFIVCPNKSCKRYTLTIHLGNAIKHSTYYEFGQVTKTWHLLPQSKAQSFPTYIPKPILDDYNEACLIQDLSPKASATLARRCLQGIIRDFWKVKTGRLVDEINQIRDKIDPLTWQAIEAVRTVGNIGAHMESDINLIVDVDSDEAGLLLKLIEVLLKDWYIERENKKSHFESVAKLAAEKKMEKKG